MALLSNALRIRDARIKEVIADEHRTVRVGSKSDRALIEKQIIDPDQYPYRSPHLPRRAIKRISRPGIGLE